MLCSRVKRGQPFELDEPEWLDVGYSSSAELDKQPLASVSVSDVREASVVVWFCT